MTDPRTPSVFRRDGSDELRVLIELEKVGHEGPGSAAVRLAERLGPLLSPAPLSSSVEAGERSSSGARPGIPSPTLSPSLGVLVKVGLATFLAGLGAGAAVHSAIAKPATVVRYVDRVVEAEVASPAAPPTPADASVAQAPSATPARSPPRTVQRSTAPSTRSQDKDLNRERQLVDTARAALARHDETSALGALEEHAAAFPRGQLASAREALAIQALVNLGRTDEARVRADLFRRQFAGSLYAPVVDRALATIP